MKKSEFRKLKVGDSVVIFNQISGFSRPLAVTENKKLNLNCNMVQLNGHIYHHSNDCDLCFPASLDWTEEMEIIKQSAITDVVNQFIHKFEEWKNKTFDGENGPQNAVRIGELMEKKIYPKLSISVNFDKRKE